MRRELQPTKSYEAPFVSFPQNPRLIELDGFSVLDYISPEYMNLRIRDLSSRIKLDDFDRVVVNAKGGWFLYYELARLQLPRQRPIEVVYRRPPQAYGAIVDNPIPSALREKRLLIVEDILDSGGVLETMMRDAPNSTCLVAVKKRNIPNQIQTANTYSCVETDNLWLGGCGMDFGNESYSENFPRSYPGIVVMPELLIKS